MYFPSKTCVRRFLFFPADIVILSFFFLFISSSPSPTPPPPRSSSTPPFVPLHLKIVHVVNDGIHVTSREGGEDRKKKKPPCAHLYLLLYSTRFFTRISSSYRRQYSPLDSQSKRDITHARTICAKITLVGAKRVRCYDIFRRFFLFAAVARY